MDVAIRGRSNIQHVRKLLLRLQVVLKDLRMEMTTKHTKSPFQRLNTVDLNVGNEK